MRYSQSTVLAKFESKSEFTNFSPECTADVGTNDRLETDSLNSKGYGAINYIKLLNWVWDELVFAEGCKPSAIVLFLAVVDSINRNRWRKTRIAFDCLINKCKFSKQTYLDARKWLIDHECLQVEVGKNGYQMAVFDLGIAVRKRTAMYTADLTADLPADLPHLYKQLNTQTDKPKTLNISFDIFWQLYDHKMGKKASEALWFKLTDEERQTAIEQIPKYKLATPDKTFRQHPKRYLKEKTFNDEITTSHKQANKNHSKILIPQTDGAVVSL